MKLHPTVARHRLDFRGFTLMELLIVMVIIGILAALTLGAFRIAQESGARNRTISTLATIRVGLEQYKEKFGEYPDVASPEEEDTITGHSLRTGAAHMLYQAISGDGNSAIRFETPPAAGVTESDGQVGEEERDNALNTSALPKSVIYPTNAVAGTAMPRLIVDGWSRPFQYQKAQPPPANTGTGTAPVVTPTTVNPTYDLWSYGPLNNGSTAGDALDTRKDPQATATWIKNW